MILSIRTVDRYYRAELENIDIQLDIIDTQMNIDPISIRHLVDIFVNIFIDLKLINPR